MTDDERYPIRHGTPGGYTNRKCRCDLCRAAWREEIRARRARRRQMPVPAHVHGTENGYTNYCCRCARCRMAHSRLSEYGGTRSKRAS